MLQERWHFCRDSGVLLGSRALRERHLGLLGYQLLPVSLPGPAPPLVILCVPTPSPTGPVHNLLPLPTAAL